MLAPISAEDSRLCHELLTQPFNFENQYTKPAECHLRETLFRSLAKDRPDYLRLFFPKGTPPDRSQPWSLKVAQGAQEGIEYSAAAKGTACGHIFKSGESTYHCKTCAADDTCVLCVRCFESSEHEDHNVFISVSPGNSGCCDCGDLEAWKQEVRCSIHTAGTRGEDARQTSKDKAPVGGPVSQLPPDLLEAIRMTIARAVDYLCDVFSCSPEQLRLPKSEDSVRRDEELSRLGLPYGKEPREAQTQFALVLWNDEKHTVDDVQNQVARACRKSRTFGRQKAHEVDEVGRSVVHVSRNLTELLQMAEILEQIKVTVTVRSARDTFREQMCATIIDWIGDISGCAVGSDTQVLRNTVCEEFLKPWRTGSAAVNVDVGQDGIDDHETEENAKTRERYTAFLQPFRMAAARTDDRVTVELVGAANDNNDNDEDDDDEDDYDEMDVEEDDDMEIEVEDIRQAANAAIAAAQADAADMEIDFMDENEDVTEALEATLAGYPPPPPPPGGQPGSARRRQILTPADSDDGESTAEPRPVPDQPYNVLPKTPKGKSTPVRRSTRPSKHWLEKPAGFRTRVSEPCEDLWQRVRLDYLILYDLRLWKSLRIHLRHLYITTVVTIPNFKRILGLRFAGLYTTLSQLYLIADREPDHSIINLSVQMLTTPSITEEVVERGNFFTNLMAILYTFLTSRQVGIPEDVSPRATLAFDAGAVTNRRIFHFFMDLRWLCQSDFIHYKMRLEQRYLLQFLDLTKLHQGVCPNVRATGEHVEYESDAWISASMIVKEINKLCKQIAVSFEPKPETNDGNEHLQRALRTVAQATMINSFGYERKRFLAAEIKDDLAWHLVGPFDASQRSYSVPKGVVQHEPMSFHHPMHYLLSWLLEEGKILTRTEMRSLLTFSPNDLRDPWNPSRTPFVPPGGLTTDELLCGIFDHPLRTYVWLAQMKSGMWVRNGITLRHQAHTYRSVNHRDVGYQRDILMLQAGLVLCGSETEKPGERFLAQMLDRFEMTRWFQGEYSIRPGYEEAQQLDVIEDFFHLLVIALSERSNLLVTGDEKEQYAKVLQHDIAHVLCFKPLSHSDLKARLTDKVGDSEAFAAVLESMTNYRPPEGLSDTGTFELKPEFIELVDPYYAHYSRNHREEAESIYKKHMGRKLGKKAEDIVLEPRVEPITSGLFADLAAFTRTPLFTQIICAALGYAVGNKVFAPKMQVTRVETFLHMVLHLAMLAVVEDDARGVRHHDDGFVSLAAAPVSVLGGRKGETVVSLLATLSGMEDYVACHPTIKHILRKMQLRLPEKLNTVMGPLGAVFDRADTGSPASLSAEDKDKKKQEAVARQARVMAKMKEQQASFMQNAGLSAFGDDFDDDLDDMSITEEPESLVEQRKTWSFPDGTCILCQEDTDDQRLYGTFAYLGESNILRSTPVADDDFVNEVITTPASLDRPADSIRPFGVAGDNKRTIQKVNADGKTTSSERQGLSKGFPHQPHGIKGPVSTSCGHIMHFHCFELYIGATARRHQQQIARNQPERIELKEFICPLCKALGNTFVPIIWKAKECAYEHELHAAKSLDTWLAETPMQGDLSFLYGDSTATMQRQQQIQEIYSARSSHYIASTFAPSLVSSLQEMTLETSTSSATSPRRYSLRRGYSLSSLFRLGRGAGGEGSHSSSNDPYTSGSSPSQAEQPRMTELIEAYKRIDATITQNHLATPPQTAEARVNPVSVLSRALGLTVSAFEIAQRGMANDPIATSLLSELTEPKLIHLRILSETVESYLAVNILGTSSTNKVALGTIRRRETLAAQLFGVDSEIAMIKLRDIGEPLLLQDDVFLFFTDWLSFMAPSVAEASSVLQLCYWAEVVKTVFVYKKVVKRLNLATGACPPISEAFKLAVSGMVMDWDRYGAPLSQEEMQVMRLVVDKYGLTFLRKAIVLMHVRYGLDFECPYNLNVDSPELQRLTALLHMPSLDDICTLYTTQSPSSTALRRTTKRWLSQASLISEHQPANDHPTITLPHPAIFELVGLPKNYDTLTSSALLRRCPTTGREITDPALCLFCGEIFCSQAVCCMQNKNQGGCYQHMARCGGKIGIFINVRKCMVLFMHGPGNGSYAHAPYLDKHGEPDPTLRKHHQLFLHQRRYDKLMREAWLGHLVPTVISRKLEADINPGGWETL